MSDDFAYCGCQYEPDQEFQNKHWHEDENGNIHCDNCDRKIRWEHVDYHNGEVIYI